MTKTRYLAICKKIYTIYSTPFAPPRQPSSLPAHLQFAYSSSYPDKFASLALVGNGYTCGIGSWSAYKNFLLNGATNTMSKGADKPKPIEATKCGLV